MKTKRMGFVGSGVITEAVITGLVKSGLDLGEIVVSPRNAEVASRMAEQYSCVRIGANNQDVVDQSDIVFLAIRPQVAESVVSALKFHQGQHVVSFVAATQLDTLSAWIKTPVKITRAIPLPFVAELQGATAIYPPDETVAGLFAALGTAVQAANREQFDLLAAASALMGTYFGLLETSARWLESKGMPYGQASDYLKQLYAGLAHAMTTSPAASFDIMRGDFSTKGGLNEQVFAEFDARGGTGALVEALEAVLRRIERTGLPAS